MLALMFLLLADPAERPLPPAPPQAAQTALGFSGAILTIRTQPDLKQRGKQVQRLFLKRPSGEVASMLLTDPGGFLSVGLNLYVTEDDGFLLISEKDCVEIDPIRGRLKTCRKAVACAGRREYIGRFDWMNGYDPPRGDFRFAFRYLPTYDAAENGGCEYRAGG